MAASKSFLMKKGAKFLGVNDVFGKKGDAVPIGGGKAFEEKRRALGLQKGEVERVDVPAPKKANAKAAKPVDAKAPAG